MRVIPPTTAPAPNATVTIFGVYNNGIADASVWPNVVPLIAPAFHDQTCHAYYNMELHEADEETFNQIGTIARNEGLGASVLQTYGAAAAQSDLFAVVEISGQVQKDRFSGRKPPGNEGQSRGKQIGGDGRTLVDHRASEYVGNQLVIAVSVYSRPKAELFARVEGRYVGMHQEEVWGAVNEELKKIFPDWSCR